MGLLGAMAGAGIGLTDLANSQAKIINDKEIADMSNQMEIDKENRIRDANRVDTATANVNKIAEEERGLINHKKELQDTINVNTDPSNVESMNQAKDAAQTAEDKRKDKSLPFDTKRETEISKVGVTNHKQELQDTINVNTDPSNVDKATKAKIDMQTAEDQHKDNRLTADIKRTESIAKAGVTNQAGVELDNAGQTLDNKTKQYTLDHPDIKDTSLNKAQKEQADIFVKIAESSKDAQTQLAKHIDAMEEEISGLPAVDEATKTKVARFIGMQTDLDNLKKQQNVYLRKASIIAGDKGDQLPSTEQAKNPNLARLSDSELGGKENPDYGYGKRPDGTNKGKGYLGELKRDDGGVMTEYSVGANINGKEIDIPTLVPTLTNDEVNTILNTKEGEFPPKAIINKAVDYATSRVKAGKPVFATVEEEGSFKPVGQGLLSSSSEPRTDTGSIKAKLTKMGVKFDDRWSSYQLENTLSHAIKAQQDKVLEDGDAAQAAKFKDRYEQQKQDTIPRYKGN